MMLQFEFAIAKKNNDDLSYHVREGFAMKRVHGQYPGPAPLGYRNAIVGPGMRNIVPDPEKAPLVTKVYELAASGTYTLDELWRAAQQMGLSSSRNKPISKQTLVELLRRRANTGVFQYGGEEWHVGTYSPLVSTDLYDQVQVAMGWKKPTHRQSTRGRQFPFKGVLLYHTCGHNITAYTKAKRLSGGSTAEYTYYTCTKKSRTVKCDEAQIRNTELERAVREHLAAFEISETEAAAAIGWLQRLYEESQRDTGKNKTRWLREQKEAQNALDRLDEKLVTGVIGDDRYKLQAEKYQSALVRTDALLANQEHDAKKWLELAQSVFSSAINLGDVFMEANDTEKRRLMLYLGSNWKLSNKKVLLTPREPFSYLHSRTNGLNWRARPDSNRRSPP
ncbi:recombinase family protein [Candidatus Saccharibacteria bacterium]|nr:recombinase family protein [Candidatus Saccharibacteria bacterium]